MLDKFQSRKAITAQISEGYEYFLVVCNDDYSGYAALAPENQPSTILLSKIYLKKSSRGLGIGREMIRFLENICKQRNFKRIRLTVNKNNSSSIAFYERNGFINKGGAVKDIGNGYVMDDYIMEKPL